MQWQLDFPKVNLQNPISLNLHFLSLGSCFADGVGHWMKDHFLSNEVNPLGICFNPLSISKQLDIFSKKDDISTSLENQGLYVNLDAHSQFSHPDESIHNSQLKSAIQRGRLHYESASVLILTLGSAYAYKHIESNEIVANCHKIPSNQFEKVLLDIDAIESALKISIQTFLQTRKEAKVILTVSPVRHIKDGIIENNRSKARLLEACHLLTEKIDDCHYFPSYEGLIDVLRDYRFYNEDLVHPSKIATQFIAEKFAEFLFNSDSEKELQELNAISKRLNHKSLFPDSKADQTRILKLKKDVDELQKRFPFLNLTI